MALHKKLGKVISPSKNPKLEGNSFMKNVHVLFIENGLGKTRVNILTKQLERFGGTREQNLGKEVTHIVANKGIKLSKILSNLKVKNIPSNVCVVSADWLAYCFTKGDKVDPSHYFLSSSHETTVATQTKTLEPTLSNFQTLTESKKELLPEDKPSYNCVKPANNFEENEIAKTEMVNKSKLELHPGKLGISGSNDSSYCYSGSETEESGTEEPDNKKMKSELAYLSPEKPKGNWVCTQPSSARGENLNEHVTEKLEVLAKEYTNTQDKWRALGYKKAINAIKNYPKKLETFEEISSLPFVGERLAKKIWEIVETGHLRRLDHTNPKMDIVNVFADVWGAGPKTAETWVAHGYRTLDDLRTCATLNFQQKIGLKYYDEFLDRMERSEVEEIRDVVKAKAMEIDSNFEIEVCGSFRRGRSTCGDIDLLISHPDGKSHQACLGKILTKLKEEGYITDDLITIDKEEQRKYMGVFLLKGDNRKHRRIDIIVTPYNQWPCALLHFTGSGHLNRSMRQLAKTKGMSLSEHALRCNVVRKGHEKIHEGTPVPVFTEEDIFRHLGLDYLKPHDRNW